MSSKLNLSLDEIIKSRPKNKRTGRRRGGDNRKGRSQVAQAIKEKPYSKPTPARLPVPASESGKIIISNLHHNVTERDLRELFGQIGNIKSASLNFDSRGVSQGSGSIVFSRPADSLNALRKYHGVTLDGKLLLFKHLLDLCLHFFAGRPMKIAIPFTPTSDLPSVPISSRIGPLRQEPNKNSKARPTTNQQKSRPKPVNRRKKEARPAKSKDDLDAELDAYNSVSLLNSIPLT
ncbi:hypothetical protein DSO57_1025032 [Entomophthora muscae]|uniref:Uncharacterized protein n=1 Tax=Entomophthora muscae TaxID=34485 RepID=A0ACC2UMB5_9FUNG|nr:hypothetical protein DSO57_1025032 [Entomophthora muscae]